MRSLNLPNSAIADQLDNVPAGPGVYLMKNAQGDILYVGKAANLRHRVRSYFTAGPNLSLKQQRLVAHIHDIDFFLTASEHEALILELNLIKRHHPPYNVRLKDDKTFPYLKIDTGEEWPRVQVTRRLQEDGARYFGPFSSAKSLRQTLKAIRRIFPFRSCSRNITGTDSRSCLEYYVNNCLAPCIGAVSRDEYHKVIKDLILFLEGKSESILHKLESEMQQAAKALDFEKAAIIRDQLQAARNVIESQKIAIKLSGDQDVIALASDRDQTCAQVFFIRGGKLIGRESFTLQGTRYEAPQHVMDTFVKQFYNSSTYTPPLLLLQYPLEDTAVVEDWLQSKRESRVRILVPQRGNKKQLVDIAAENARQGLAQFTIKQQKAALEEALVEIQRELELPEVPARIEGYDISNIQGTAAVGSMVVFERGKPKPAHYRRFRIKTIAGANDYAMLQEVLQRRFRRSSDTASSWAILPDLALIDGGKGQLNAARTALEAVGIDTVPLASLAKENEAIFLPRRTKPVLLPRQSPGLQLLQRVRDEAHRFAIGYHRQRRTRETLASALDSIPGIGAKRKRALLRRFGSLQGIQDASIEELSATSGFNKGLAEKLKQYV
jgi:excinuclease ABC subunit C